MERPVFSVYSDIIAYSNEQILNKGPEQFRQKSWNHTPMIRQTLNRGLRILVNMLMNIRISGTGISICCAQAGEDFGCLCGSNFFDKPVY